ncbi:MAG: tetratricopeptide repeat protein, partial [Rhodobacter sp.]|nr:tetratricopeptide repeat protein [Rhodobacter sp.]
MSAANDISRQTVQAHLKAARAARGRGDPAAAETHLQAARDADPDGQVAAVGLLAAELHRAAGRPEAADAELETVQARHPGNVWAPYHRGELARQRGDLAAAQAFLRAAQANDPDDRVAMIPVLEADLLVDAGRPAAARLVLEQMTARHPQVVWGHQRLALLAEVQNDPDAARRHFEAALRIDDTRLGLQLGLVRQLLALADHQAAMTRLERLRVAHGPRAEIMLPLVRACRGAGQGAQEEAALIAAVAAHPYDRQLLRHVFATGAREAEPETMVMVLDLVRRRLGGDLADELNIRMLLQIQDYRAALDAIRGARRARRSVAEARNLATALFGAHRFATGLRYVRACLRHWPSDRGFWEVYVQQGLRLGRLAEVGLRLEIAAKRLPRHVLVSHRLTLCAYRDDLEGAVRCFETLRDMGLAQAGQRRLLSKLVFNLADPAAAAAIEARIGPAGAFEDRPLHRAGLPGMMAMEFDLERRAKPAPDLRDWVRARPGSSIAAIRLIDAWRGAVPPEPTPATVSETGVPRHIHQYWDSPDPPAAVAEMVQGWANAPGFSHRLYDRAAGLKYVRQNCGPDGLRAFHLAQNAAQEADFLRLCILAREGGIWADADDVLYGDLGRLLRAGQGLILYREPQGGALGNNFIAAPPGHPVMVLAARLAAQALLQRASELAWFKTGPGLLTRAVGQYLAETDSETAR